MTHVMVDVEALGTTPGSVIVSIGAVAFDPTLQIEDRRQFYCVVDVVSAQKRGCTIDAATVRWWFGRSDAARTALLVPDARPLVYALDSLSTFLWPFLGSSFRIWAKPPSFDLALLKAAYALCGRTEPWSHRDERDLRTLLDFAAVIDAPRIGTEHNALDDAKHQAALACLAYGRLSRSYSI